MDKAEVRIRLGKRDPLVVGNNVFKSFNDWNLTEKEMEKARIELGETEEMRQKCLQELKRRLSKGNYRTDDSFLLRYLRIRKFDCDKAYQSVKQLYEIRKNPEFYGPPSNLRSAKISKVFSCLPYVDEEDRVLHWNDLEMWNPREVSFEEFAQQVTACLDIVSMNPKCQVNGVISLFDAKAFSTTHISVVLKRNRWLQCWYAFVVSMPWRVNKVVILNAGRPARILYNMLRPFLSKKLVQRVIFLGSDLNELHQHVNPALLPKKLGGKLEDEECMGFAEVLDNIPYLEYERSFTGE